MIELYYLEEADSICSNRPRMTFVEKGINDWVPRRMSLMDRDQFKPEYLRLNPKAQVPTLVHDGRAIAFFDRIMGKTDTTMADGRQWVMGESVTLVETNYAPFIKVVELFRLIFPVWHTVPDQVPDVRRCGLFHFLLYVTDYAGRPRHIFIPLL